jgi:AmmeMemoRadiSam system protein B
MRPPAAAGRFYPSDRTALISEIERCFKHKLGPGIPGGCRSERKLAAAVAPHAGYRASGMNAAHVYKEIAEDGLPDAYIVIGPDHCGIPYGAAVCNAPYSTPLGVCRTHEGIAKKLRKAIPDDAHRFEHSVEVQIPFIQYIDPDARVVPIVMSDQSYRSAEYLSNAISEACDGIDHVIIASSDLSHYVPKPRAESEAKDVIERICALDAVGMYDAVAKRRITACGPGPMAVAAMSDCSHSKLLMYSDSFDSLGADAEGVVAYASIAFFK